MVAKILIGIRDSSALADQLEDAVFDKLLTNQEICSKECDQVIESRCKHIRQKLSKWFSGDELLTVEYDTEMDTLSIVVIE